HPPRTQFESPAVMTFPLMVLAVFAVLVGFVLGPTHLFAHWLEKTPGWPHMHEEPHLNFALMGISTIMALGGIALAWWMYVRQPELPAKVAKSAQSLYQLSLNKFYIDEIYAAFIVRPAEGLANLLRRADTGGIDSMVDLTGNLPRMVGNLFRPIQNGLVQFYALAMVLGLTVFLLSLLYKM
ncbi:MAG: NADH-quinone oxidoreductase subunit L, partial [Gemmataceae bacterium]